MFSASLGRKRRAQRSRRGVSGLLTDPKEEPEVTSTRAPWPTYQSCGGFRAQPVSCGRDDVCVDDPYVHGCDMACDRPGICVKPVFYGGFAGL